MKFTQKTQAIQLRKEGKSYSEIKKIIGVSKSTLSSWLKDIVLTEEHKLRLNRLQSSGYLGAKKQQIFALRHHNEIKEKAKREAVELAKSPFFIAGLMLYWAEGGKKYGSVQFSNSDPAMIKIMMRWFREFCFVSEKRFRIGLFIHSLHTQKDCLSYWQKITRIPLTQFHKPYIKPTVLSNRKNKLYEGTCVIVIHSRDLLSKIIGWKNGVEQIFVSNN